MLELATAAVLALLLGRFGGQPDMVAFCYLGALGVSLATVRRWSNDGHLRGYRTPGGQRRFSRDQLDTFLSSLTAADDDGAAA